MAGLDPGLVAVRLAEVRARIAAAGGVDVAVMAVTTTFGPDAIAAAMDAGCRDIGENYAQELVSKLSALATIAPLCKPEVHFIGHLQSNKVRALVPYVHLWQTVDRPSLVDELAKRVPGARVLLQVNTTGEAAKSGCHPDALAALLDRARASGLAVEGLMTIGPLEGGERATRSAFRRLRTLADGAGLTTVSMGMTHDLEIAVEEGATMVRVGTALFGPRPPIA